MKKYLAVLFVFIFVIFTFFACQKNNSDGNSDDVSGESVSDGAENASDPSKDVTTVTTVTKTVVFSSKSVEFDDAISKLESNQEEFVGDLGVTEKDKKIVAYYDNDDETQVILCELKDNVIFKVYNYRFYKDEKIYKGFENLADVNDPHYKVYKDEKCIRYDESNKYRGKSFTEMLEKLNGYDIKY